MKRSFVRGWRIEPLPADIDGLVEDLLANASQQRLSILRTVIVGALSVTMIVLLILWLVRRSPRADRYLRSRGKRLADLILGRRLELPKLDLK